MTTEQIVRDDAEWQHLLNIAKTERDALRQQLAAAKDECDRLHDVMVDAWVDLKYAPELNPSNLDSEDAAELNAVCSQVCLRLQAEVKPDSKPAPAPEAKASGTDAFECGYNGTDSRCPVHGEDIAAPSPPADAVLTDERVMRLVEVTRSLISAVPHPQSIHEALAPFTKEPA